MKSLILAVGLLGLLAACDPHKVDAADTLKKCVQPPASATYYTVDPTNEGFLVRGPFMTNICLVEINPLGTKPPFMR